jgi:hypothetical protein
MQCTQRLCILQALLQIGLSLVPAISLQNANCSLGFPSQSLQGSLGLLNRVRLLTLFECPRVLCGGACFHVPVPILHRFFLQVKGPFIMLVLGIRQSTLALMLNVWKMRYSSVACLVVSDAFCIQLLMFTPPRLHCYLMPVSGVLRSSAETH